MKTNNNNNEVLKTKKVMLNGKVYDITLTREEMDEIENDVKIAKLNGRTFDECLQNAGWSVRKYWPEMLASVWQAMEVSVEEGMGATMNLWSDRRAMTVTKVISPKKIEVVENETKCVDYYAGNYEVLDTLTNKHSHIFTLRRNGTWVEEGQPKKFGSVTLTLGFRRHYIDPSF